MNKILFALLGIIFGVVIYINMLSNVPSIDAVDVTLEKPEVERISQEIEEEVDVEIDEDFEKIKELNKRFKPAYDKRGNLRSHPSGFSYLYDKENNPVGLMSDRYLHANSIEVKYDEGGELLTHESGNPFAYSDMGEPVALIVEGVVAFGDDIEPTYEESSEIVASLFSNAYYLKSADIERYKEMNLVNVGQKNPMWYEVKRAPIDITDPDGNNLPGNPSVPYEDEDENTSNPDNEYQLSPGETIGYDTNTSDLKIVNVVNIEDRVRSSGVLPVDKIFYKVSSEFGPRKDPFTQEQRFHVGLDIAESGIAGRYVYSVLAGNVEVVSFNNSLGNYIVVSHDNFNMIYAHLEAFARDIKVGSVVSAGTPIGYVGNTGRSTGPHLHVEFDVDGVKLDPKMFLDLIN